MGRIPQSIESGSPRTVPIPPAPQYNQPNPDNRLDPSRAREQMSNAPHLSILRAMERLDEAIASKRDPWPAYYAFTSILDAWAEGDEQFLRDMQKAQALRGDTAAAQHNMEYSWQAVSILRTPYVKLMRRLGYFKELNLPPSKLSEARKAQRPQIPTPASASPTAREPGASE